MRLSDRRLRPGAVPSEQHDSRRRNRKQNDRRGLWNCSLSSCSCLTWGIGDIPCEKLDGRASVAKKAKFELHPPVVRLIIDIQELNAKIVVSPIRCVIDPASTRRYVREIGVF